MDEVIIGGAFLGIVNDFLGTNYKSTDFKDYYIQDSIPEEYREDFLDFFFSKNIYDYGEILPYAYEVMEELNKVYKLLIGTAYEMKERPRESHKLIGPKHVFLYDNFPFLSPSSYGFINDKDWIDCDISIDDRLINAIGKERKILFPTYHNLDILDEELMNLGVERANGWLDIKRLLLK